MCIFVTVLVSVMIIVYCKMRNRIKELKAELRKTPTRGADGRYMSRKA